MPESTTRATTLVRDLLDRRYDVAARRVLSVLASMTDRGIVEQRLRELEAEAERLSQAGERLAPDNPVLRALLADLEPELRRAARLLGDAANNLIESSVTSAGDLTRSLVFTGRRGQTLAEIGVAWNVPDPAAVSAFVSYTSSAAWQRELGSFTQTVLDSLQNQIVLGFIQGWNPRRTAKALAQLAANLPLARANNLMRTAQLTAYRDAAVLHRLANADILEEQIRIAALDTRTCLACIALHGTRMSIGERVNDHHQGRCTSISVLRGVERVVESGEDWFARQSPQRQRQIAGDANYEALRAGRVQLRDFVRPYFDPVFGEMVREASLLNLLGGAARSFYRR